MSASTSVLLCDMYSRDDSHDNGFKFGMSFSPGRGVSLTKCFHKLKVMTGLTLIADVNDSCGTGIFRFGMGLGLSTDRDALLTR